MSFGGSYDPSDPPQRGGLFINVEVAALPRVRDVSRGVTALVVKSDWGPENVITEINSPSQAEAIFGDGGTAASAISQALAGEGIPGRSGASTVFAYRIVGSSGASATKTFNNTASSPAVAITLTALYDGARGNNITVTIRESPGDATRNDVIISESGVQREMFTTLKTDITGMVAAINAGSSLVSATAGATTDALATVTDSALAGGDSGTSVVAGDHTAAMDTFESYGGFDTFAVDNLPDDTSSIRTAYITWVNRLNSEGKLFHMVFGGPASELYSAAITRADALDSENAIAVWGDVEIGGVTYSSAQIAPWIAGILSAATYTRSISGATLTDATLLNPASNAEIELMVRGGVIPMYSDVGVVRLQRARTTYRPVSTDDPKAGKFDSLLFMRRLHHTFRIFDGITRDHIIGREISNTPNGRDAILGLFKVALQDLEEANVTIPGAVVMLDDSRDNTGETLHILLGYQPALGVEQILGRVTIPASTLTA